MVAFRLRIDSQGQIPIAHPRLVDWRYTRTMGIPLTAGRHFEERDTATSERMAANYCRLLEQVATAPALPIGQLQLLGAGERHRQLIEWNAKLLQHTDGYPFSFPDHAENEMFGTDVIVSQS